jgi:hypothetical protein
MVVRAAAMNQSRGCQLRHRIAVARAAKSFLQASLNSTKKLILP